MKIEEIKSLKHHAYAIAGDGDQIRAEIVKALEIKHIYVHGNPDFFERKFETLIIDDAREIKMLHETRPIGKSGKKIFILIVNNVNHEAQNALLKLLEEPNEYAYFFIIIPSLHLLLPTVKSRMLLIDASTNDKEMDLSEAKKFMKLSVAKRLEEVKKLVDDISKEKRSRQDAIQFLNNLERVVYEEKGVKDGGDILQSMALARTYVNDRAPSLKMLLEYVALNI